MYSRNEIPLKVSSCRQSGVICCLRQSEIWFAKAQGLPASCYRALIKGDSGNPSFLWLDGEPVFIETHSGGGPGAGPFISFPKTYQAINTAMKDLSEANSAPVHQLKPVRP